MATVPYTFTDATAALAAEVNANFAAVLAAMLDKTGDTMTGTLIVPALTSTGAITGNLTGNVTGNVTGNTSGSAGSCTGNAATATKLTTARAINGVDFDGTAAITLPVTTNTGNISIASQTALDFIYASSSSQFARVAVGSALQYPRVNAAGNGWEFATAITTTTVTQKSLVMSIVFGR
jgi:hypothetical protein